MKTMDNQDRTELENQILVALCSRPDLFDLFQLSEKDFKHTFNKDIFLRLCELKATDKEVSLISLSQDFDFAEIRHLITTDIFIPQDYLAMCEKLRENTLRIEINRKAEGCNDSQEFFHAADLLKLTNTIANLETFDDQITKYIEENQQIIERKKSGQSIGLLNYWDKFSEKVPMMKGEYCVIGANTSVGKTSFSLNLAVNVAALGQKVLFISLEMPRKQIFDKISAILAQRPVYEFKYAINNLQDTRLTLESLKDNFRFIYAPDATTATVSQLVRRMGKVDLVVVDYIQLLRDQTMKNDNENLRLSRISNALRVIAGQNECVLITPSQLSRDNAKQNREPRLSDLRDSGSLEQDANIVLLLHRDETENKAKTKVIIAKNRMGERGEIDFAFNAQCSYFEELKEQKRPIQSTF